jgi:DnaK suppressor protein
VIQDNLGRYKQELLEKRAELELLLRTLDSIAVEHAADEIDNVQLSDEREFAIDRLERWTALLGEVKEALNRIPSGTYGVCSDCHEAINSRRLMAVPWTAYCLQCQMDRDRRAHEAQTEEFVYQFTPMRPKHATQGYDVVRRRRKTLAAGG